MMGFREDGTVPRMTPSEMDWSSRVLHIFIIRTQWEIATFDSNSLHIIPLI